MTEADAAEPAPLIDAKQFLDRVFLHGLKIPDPPRTQPENELVPNPQRLQHEIIGLRHALAALTDRVAALENVK